MQQYVWSLTNMWWASSIPACIDLYPHTKWVEHDIIGQWLKRKGRRKQPWWLTSACTSRHSLIKATGRPWRARPEAAIGSLNVNSRSWPLHSKQQINIETYTQAQMDQAWKLQRLYDKQNKSLLGIGLIKVLSCLLIAVQGFELSVCAPCIRNKSQYKWKEQLPTFTNLMMRMHIGKLQQREQQTMKSCRGRWVTINVISTIIEGHLQTLNNVQGMQPACQGFKAHQSFSSARALRIIASPWACASKLLMASAQLTCATDTLGLKS